MLIPPRQLSLNFDPPHAARLRRPVPVIVRRIAIRSRVSHWHAIALIEANGIGGAR